MIIAHRTAPGAYSVLTSGTPVRRQVDTTVVILDSTIADPELVDAPRDVVIWDATLVDGEIVRTERTVHAFEQTLPVLGLRHVPVDEDGRVPVGDELGGELLAGRVEVQQTDGVPVVREPAGGGGAALRLPARRR